mgnify:CR=1 FL=1
MAKTIDELYSPAERAEILSAFKIRIKFPPLRRCEVESVFYTAPVRCGMSVCLEESLKALSGHQVVIHDFKGELIRKFYEKEDQTNG